MTPFDITNIEKAREEYLKDCKECNDIVNNGNVELREFAEAMLALREKLGDISLWSINDVFNEVFCGMYTFLRNVYWLNVPNCLTAILHRVIHDVMDDGFLGVFRVEYEVTNKVSDKSVKQVYYFMTDNMENQNAQVAEYTEHLNSRCEQTNYNQISYKLYYFNKVGQLTGMVKVLSEKTSYVKEDMVNEHLKTDGFLDEYLKNVPPFVAKGYEE